MERNGISKELLEGLVDRVVEELKQRMGQKTELSHREPKKIRGGKKRLLLLGSLKDAECQSLSGSYELIEDPERGDWEFLLVSKLSVQTMAYVSHGIFGDAQSSCILQGLLEGRPVFFLERGLEYRSYKDYAPKTLYLFYQKQESVLKYMGIQFLSHVMDLPRLSGRGGLSLENPLDLTHLSLLQESELIRARGLGYRAICLKETAKITPLAMDYVNRHGLAVYRQ